MTIHARNFIGGEWLPAQEMAPDLNPSNTRKVVGEFPRAGAADFERAVAAAKLRRLLIIAASGVVRWAKRKGVPAGSWLGRMLARKPPMLVIVALANKNARITWALLTRGGIYRAPAVST